MTHLLPPNLLRLFAPRPPLEYAKPLGRDPGVPLSTKKSFTGVAELLETIRQEAAELEAIEDSAGRPNGVNGTNVIKYIEPTMTEEDKFQLRQAERKRKREEIAKRMAKYDPAEDANAIGDPYKTLFVSRLSRDTTEDDLREVFDRYGPIEKLTLVRDNEGKSRRYAFILYEREKDMKIAYKESDGLKLKGARLMVDVERGRTVKGWKPMRLGGGLGGRPKPVTTAAPPPDLGPPGFRGGGGMRGGGGGGFRGRGLLFSFPFVSSLPISLISMSFGVGLRFKPVL